MYTEKKGKRFSRPQPGGHLPNSLWLNFSRSGWVWLLTSRLGTEKSLTVYLQCTNVHCTMYMPGTSNIQYLQYVYFTHNMVQGWWAAGQTWLACTRSADTGRWGESPSATMWTWGGSPGTTSPSWKWRRYRTKTSASYTSYSCEKKGRETSSFSFRIHRVYAAV